MLAFLMSWETGVAGFFSHSTAAQALLSEAVLKGALRGNGREVMAMACVHGRHMRSSINARWALHLVRVSA